jgi:hypothetical protein
MMRLTSMSAVSWMACRESWMSVVSKVVQLWKMLGNQVMCEQRCAVQQRCCLAPTPP